MSTRRVFTKDGRVIALLEADSVFTRDAWAKNQFDSRVLLPTEEQPKLGDFVIGNKFITPQRFTNPPKE